MGIAEVLLDGKWQAASAESTFQAENPATEEKLPIHFPVSDWSDCDRALSAAALAVSELRQVDPKRLAAFLEAFATNIESASESIIAAANEETGLPVTPRLRDVELPRTTNQMRLGAIAAQEESWKQATIDTGRNIRSCFAAIGPVVVFGPNNFPLAFNGISGGDFVAAIAAGNPVIAKAHPLHPNTTRLLAEQAHLAIIATGLPSATVQMLYQVSNQNGIRLVSDSRVGAVGFTGSRAAGLHLKRAAEESGKPIYLEMSSVNPVIFLAGALAERGEELARELVDSCLAGAGQFCTSPNLLLLCDSPDAESFLQQVANAFRGRVTQPLLSASTRNNLQEGVTALIDEGARVVAGGAIAAGPGYRFENTLLRVSAKEFLRNPSGLQREVFGNATLAITFENTHELEATLRLLEGNLTGTVYSAKSGADDTTYASIEPILRNKVGRLLNDKMPTGVAVSAAMNHGGPYPAASHPGFTSVGIPSSLARFATLQCYDGVREERLPAILRNTIHNPNTWRSIDGAWVKG